MSFKSRKNIYFIYFKWRLNNVMIFTKSWEELGVLIDGGAKTVNIN